jgi:hypothetical protein
LTLYELLDMIVLNSVCWYSINDCFFKLIKKIEL